MRCSAFILLLLGSGFISYGSEDEHKQTERIPELLRQLEDTDFDKRNAAATALEGVGEDGVRELEKAVESSKDVEVRTELKHVLATIAATPPTQEQLNRLKTGLWHEKPEVRTYSARRLMVHCHEMVQYVADVAEQKVPGLLRLLTSPEVLNVVRVENRAEAFGCIHKIVEHAGYGLRQRKMASEITEIADILLTSLFEEKELSNSVVLAKAIAELGTMAWIDAKASRTLSDRILTALAAKEASIRKKAVLASSAIAHLLQGEDARKLSDAIAKMFPDPNASVGLAVAYAFIGRLDNSYSNAWSLIDRASEQSKRSVMAGLLKLLNDNTISNSYDRTFCISTLADLSEFLESDQRQSAIEIVRQTIETECQMLNAASQAGAVSLNHLRDLKDYLSKLEQSK